MHAHPKGKEYFDQMRKGKGVDRRAGNLSAYQECLIRSYEDLESPKRHFVAHAVGRNPYSMVLEALGAVGEVVDDTDVNCDVCFTYIVHYDKCLTIRLSMVGPYAVMMSYGVDGLGKARVIAKRTQCEDPSELLVLDLLDKSGFKILSEEELSLRVAIKLRRGSRASSLYAALFEVDSEEFWKSKCNGGS